MVDRSEDLDHVMSLEFVSYNQSVVRNPSCDQMIRVELRRMRLAFIYKFLSSILASFELYYSLEHNLACVAYLSTCQARPRPANLSEYQTCQPVGLRILDIWFS